MEYIDVCNEKNELVGRTASREEVHAKGLWHRTVHIYVQRAREGTIEILIHRRSQSKDMYPGLLDPVFGGHVSAGDTELETARKELFEELGFAADMDRLEYKGWVRKSEGENSNDNEFNSIFVYQLSNEEEKHLKPNPSEVDKIDWIERKELKEMLCAGSPEWRPSATEAQESFEILGQ